MRFVRPKKSLAVLFLLGCGTDQFGSMDASPDTTPMEGGQMIEGGGGDGGDGGMSAPKPRLFVSIVDTQGGPSSLYAWEDPDNLSAPRAPEVNIPLANAFSVVVAKNKRVFVAGLQLVYAFDKPFALTSSSMPATIDKNSFSGLSNNINVGSFAYNASVDLLVTVDDGDGALQSFKNASSMSIPSASAARFGTMSDGYLHAAIGSNGELYGAKSSTSTLFFKNANNASGMVGSDGFAIGTGVLRIGGGHLFVASSDGSALVYVYQEPIANSMPSWQYQIKTAFGASGTTDIANDVALSPSWLAVSVKNPGGVNTGFICVLSNPSAVDGNTACANKIAIADGVPSILMERNGKLFVSIISPSVRRIEIYKTPLTDTMPSVKFDLGANKLASGFAIAE